MKHEVKKLKVSRETLRHLTEAELKEAAAGISITHITIITTITSVTSV